MFTMPSNRRLDINCMVKESSDYITTCFTMTFATYVGVFKLKENLKISSIIDKVLIKITLFPNFIFPLFFA